MIAHDVTELKLRPKMMGIAMRRKAKLQRPGRNEDFDRQRNGVQSGQRSEKQYCKSAEILFHETDHFVRGLRRLE